MSIIPLATATGGAPTSSAAATPSRIGVGVLLLLCLATWAVSHSYEGLFHDARLYTLQALSHLHPGSLNQDVFLKYGSQDRFTLFSPVYAAASRLLGIDHGAAALTLLSQAALLAGAYALARTVLSTSMALAGVAVLVAIPGEYGAHRIFTCIEAFLTPRMAAEALVLAALAAALTSRRILAAALMVTAGMMHPVMAATGVAALFFAFVAVPRPRLTVALAVAGIAVLIALAFVTFSRFDDTWLTLIDRRSPYLFLAHWHLDDWAGVAVCLSTLLLGNRALLHPPARIVAASIALTVVCGLAITLIACDLLHLVLFTQAQPWRWQWLGVVVAALLLPNTLLALWARDLAGRTAALLLIAAWIFGSNVNGLFAAVAALFVLAVMNRLKPGEARLMSYGAVGLLFIAILWRVATNLEFTDAMYMEPTLPWWYRKTVSFAHDGCAAMAIVALAWTLAHRPRGSGVLLAIGGLTLALCAALLPQIWKNWTELEYPASLIARYSSLREHIPSNADVFWPDSPLSVWILLDRPSYISVTQTSGMVFSRPSAIELERRANALRAALPPATFMNWSAGGSMLALDKFQLSAVCDSGAVTFLVTSADLGREPDAFVAAIKGPASKKVRLYRCPAQTG
jgi:hypothetical protein